MVRLSLMRIDYETKVGLLIYSDALALPDTILHSNSSRASKGIGYGNPHLPPNLD